MDELIEELIEDICDHICIYPHLYSYNHDPAPEKLDNCCDKCKLREHIENIYYASLEKTQHINKAYKGEFTHNY